MGGACFLVVFRGIKVIIMISIAERTAYGVLENTGKSVTEIALANGASPTYVSSGALTQTKAFKNIVGPWRERTAKRVSQIVDRSIAELVGVKGTKTKPAIVPRDLSSTSAKDLLSMVDTGIKNVQLLTGGATGNVSLAVLLGKLEVPQNDEDVK